VVVGEKVSGSLVLVGGNTIVSVVVGENVFGSSVLVGGNTIVWVVVGENVREPVGSFSVGDNCAHPPILPSVAPMFPPQFVSFSMSYADFA